MAKKKERVVENAWPSDRTETKVVDYPKRLTVRMDCGLALAALEWMMTAEAVLDRTDHLELTTELGQFVEHCRDALLWDPAEDALAEMDMPEGEVDMARLWAALQTPDGRNAIGWRESLTEGAGL